MTGKRFLALGLSLGGYFFLLWVIMPLDLPSLKAGGLIFMGTFTWIYVICSLLSLTRR